MTGGPVGVDGVCTYQQVDFAGDCGFLTGPMENSEHPSVSEGLAAAQSWRGAEGCRRGLASTPEGLLCEKLGENSGF